MLDCTGTLALYSALQVLSDSMLMWTLLIPVEKHKSVPRISRQVQQAMAPPASGHSCGLSISFVWACR